MAPAAASAAETVPHRWRCTSATLHCDSARKVNVDNLLNNLYLYNIL